MTGDVSSGYAVALVVGVDTTTTPAGGRPDGTPPAGSPPSGAPR